MTAIAAAAGAVGRPCLRSRKGALTERKLLFLIGRALFSSSTTIVGVGAMSAIEAAKEQAARSAVRNHVNTGDVVGVGSGSTIVYAVKMLKELQERDGVRVKCIPTSFQARQLILENGLELTSLEVDPVLNVAIDGIIKSKCFRFLQFTNMKRVCYFSYIGADEADRDLTLIKGGGGCLAQEKVVAGFAKGCALVANLNWFFLQNYFPDLQS